MVLFYIRLFTLQCLMSKKEKSIRCAENSFGEKKESVENHFEFCCMTVRITWIYTKKKYKELLKP